MICLYSWATSLTLGCTSVIPALKKQTEEDHSKFEVHVVYIYVVPAQLELHNKTASNIHQKTGMNLAEFTLDLSLIETSSL